MMCFQNFFSNRLIIKVTFQGAFVKKHLHLETEIPFLTDDRDES